MPHPGITAPYGLAGSIALSATGFSRAGIEIARGMQHLDGFGQRVLLAGKRSHEPSTPNCATVFKPAQRERDFAPRKMGRFGTEHLARENSVTLEQLEREVARFDPHQLRGFRQRRIIDQRPARLDFSRARTAASCRVDGRRATDSSARSALRSSENIRSGAKLSLLTRPAAAIRHSADNASRSEMFARSATSSRY